MAMFKDVHTSYRARWFYSSTTVGYVSILILVILLSKAYLYAGCSSFLPVYLVLIIAEFIKYAYILVFYRMKDNSCNPKQGSKLISIVNVLKEIKIITLIRDTLTVASSVCVYYFMAVLFGAQGINKFEETFMFSTLLGILTCFPLLLNIGFKKYAFLLNNWDWNGIVDPFEYLIVRNCVFTFLSTWLGAFVIPLDWGREWQAWPIPCSLGALIGFDASQICHMIEDHYKFRSSTTSTKLKGKFR